jgi:hypothetical protein
MTLAAEQVTLTLAEIAELNQQLATMRHDINNHLSLMMAAVELIQRKPEAATRMSATLVSQPPKVVDAVRKFSAAFESRFGIQRPHSH